MNNEDIQELLKQLDSTPNAVAELVEGLSAQAIVMRSESGDFSVLENICHLRDIEVEGYTVRIQRLLSEDYPELPDIDGGKLAVERDYNSQGLSAALTAFTDARRQNLNLLNNLSVEQFERSGELQGVGPITLNKLLEMMCVHDDGHVNELRIARRRLLNTREV